MTEALYGEAVRLACHLLEVGNGSRRYECHKVRYRAVRCSEGTLDVRCRLAINLPL